MIAKTAIIDPSVQIGEGVEIGDFTIIKSGVVIEAGASIGSYCIIEEETHIGMGVILQGFNRVGKRCLLELGSVMKLQSVLTSDAIVREGAFLGVNSVTLGSDSDRKQVGGTVIGKCAYIGGHSIIAPGVVVPEDTIVGANSYLRTINKEGTYVGNPACKKK